MRKNLILVAIAAVALIGCRNEQSELDLNKIKDVAHVEGQVVYSLGQDTLAADYLADVIVPAIGRKVFIEVNLSEYKGGAEGKKIYEGIVDSTGMFKMDIPVPSKGIQAQLRLEEFTAERTTYLKMEDGKPVFETRLCKYEVDPSLAAIQLLPGKNIFMDEEKIMYQPTVIDMKDYSENVVLSGILKLPVEDSYMMGSYKVAKDVVVELTIVDGVDNANGEYIPFTYGFSTDANGAFTANLPIKSLRQGFKVEKMVIMAKGDKAFKHYLSNGSSMDVEGAYELRAGEAQPVADFITNIVPDVACALGELAMKFTPYYNNGITASLPEPEDWHSNLAGWILGTAEFKDYAAVKTVSGNVHHGVETAFGVGEYIAAPWEVQLDLAYASTKTISIKCDANGAFAVDIPVKGSDDKVGINVTVQNPKVIRFEHIWNAKGEKKIINEGGYTQKNITKNGAEWNELGDFYMVFSPSSMVKTYSQNLLGWLRIQDYDYTATIKGSAMLEKETAYLVGENVPAEGRRVKLEIQNYGGYPVKTVVVPVKADGSFEAVIPVEQEVSQYKVNVYMLEADQEESAYTNYKANSQKVVAGTYNYSPKQFYPGLKSKDDADWNDMGVNYFDFSSTDGSFVKYNLPVWFHKQGCDESITVSGKAYFAVEDSYLVGKYVAGNNAGVKVTVDGNEFDVLVKDGKFSMNFPVKYASEEPSCSVAASGLDYEGYTHYTRDAKRVEKVKKLDGKYNVYKQIDGEEWNDLGEIYYKFDGVTGYEAELAGWLIRSNGKKRFEKTATITGSFRYPVETAATVGSYVAAVKEPVILDLGSDKVTGITDANGDYAVVVPVEYEDSKLSVSVLNGTGVDYNMEYASFTHYRRLNSSIEIEGKYQQKEDDNASSEWNVMGTRYFRFVPTDILSVENWTLNIPGWFIVKKADNKGTISIRLYAQMAYEKKDGGTYVGAWKNVGNHYATVHVNGCGINQNFKTVVTGNQINFTLPSTEALEEGVTTLDVTVTINQEESMTKTSQDGVFDHHPDPTKDDVQKLDGTYSTYAFSETLKYGDVTAKMFTTKKSAKYMFYPNSTPSTWSQYAYDMDAEVN